MTDAAIDYATPSTRPRLRPGREPWRARLEGYWFKPTGPGNLGFARLVFFGARFWFHSYLGYTIWGPLPASFHTAHPILPLDLLGLCMPTLARLGWPRVICKASL